MSVPHADDTKVRALAALQSNDGNLARTAREVGLPRSTLQRWRNQALADGGGDDLLPHTAPWAEIRERAAEKFLETAEKARQIVDRNLDKLRDTDMSMGDVQRAAVTSGIMADKAKHMRSDGPEIFIDARTIEVRRLAALPLDELLAMEADLRAAEAGLACQLGAGATEGDASVAGAVILPESGGSGA